jgi:hypothetical protein
MRRKTMEPTEQQLDDQWYEAYANAVHRLGKAWPDNLTNEEYTACEQYADSVVRRPEHERD